jgi:hypothetical protein
MPRSVIGFIMGGKGISEGLCGTGTGDTPVPVPHKRGFSVRSIHRLSKPTLFSFPQPGLSRAML